MTVTLTLGARGLPNKDRFSKSDPFLVLFLVTESGPPKFLKRTETIKVRVKKVLLYIEKFQNNLNPGWKPLEVADEDFDLSKKSSLLK